MLAKIDDARLRDMLRRFPDEATQHLFEKYQRRMVALARTITFDPIYSEDIVQDTFLHLLQHHKIISRHHQMPLESYIVKVVKYKSIDYAKGVAQLTDQQLKRYYQYGNSISDSNPENDLIEREIGEEVRNLIDRLTKKERQCLLMKIDQGMDIEMIAFRLKVSVKAIERNITSAKKRLKRLWLEKNRPFSFVF